MRNATDEEAIESGTYMGMCLMDSVMRGEAAFAPSSFFPMFLDESVEAQARLSRAAGWAWTQQAAKVAFYIDHGMTDAMLKTLEALIVVRKVGQSITFRTIEDEHDAIWMRSFIDGLPSYIRQHLDNVRVG